MDSFSINFFLRASAKLSIKKVIYGRLIINRAKSDFSTSFSIEPKDWDEAKQAPKNNFIIKQELTDIENSIYRIRRRFIDEDISYKPNLINS